MGWSGSPASHLDPVQYVSALAENEELKSDLETALQQLNQAYQNRDKLMAENRKLKNEVCRVTLFYFLCGMCNIIGAYAGNPQSGSTG